MAKRKETIIKLLTIAGQNHQRCKITYIKGSQFARKSVLTVRNIAPYEIQDGYLMATDTKSGAQKIKSFILKQIRLVEVLPTHFKPKWEVKL